MSAHFDTPTPTVAEPIKRVARQLRATTRIDDVRAALLDLADQLDAVEYDLPMSARVASANARHLIVDALAQLRLAHARAR